MLSLHQKKNNSTLNTILIIFILTYTNLLFSGFKFGVGDQTSHLIYILKNLEKNYFAVDPIFNDLAFFNPHKYFYEFIAILANYVNFEILIFIITFSSLLIINIILFFISKHFGLSNLISLIFVALVITIEPYDLGGGGWVTSYQFKPSLIGRIFCYSSILFALKNKILLAYLISIIGTFIHPSLNALSGLIIYLISLNITFGENNIFNKQSYIKFFKNRNSIFYSLYFLIFFTIVYYFWGTYEKFNLDKINYLKILNWRIGESINFLKFNFLQNIIFLFSSLSYFIFLIYLNKKKIIKSESIFNLYFNLYVLVIILITICSIFIINFDIIFFYQIYIFRILFLTKILTFLLILTYIQKQTKINFIEIISLLFILFLFSLNNYSRIDSFIFILLILLVFHKYNYIKIIFFLYLILFIFIIYDLSKKNNNLEIFSNSKIPFIYFSPSREFYQKIINKPFKKKIYHISNYFNNNQNSFIYRYFEDVHDISYFIKNNINNDKLILTPPSIGHKIRLLSKKSIFVDTKVIPWDTSKMINWYNRLQEVYDFNKDEVKYYNKKLLIEKYQNINDEKLNFLSKKYNISYSILYVKTKTEKKVIYNDKNFKLVLN